MVFLFYQPIYWYIIVMDIGNPHCEARIRFLSDG